MRMSLSHVAHFPTFTRQMTIVIFHKHGSAQLRVVIDGASDEAWITSDVRQKLHLPVVGRTTCSIATAFETGYAEPMEVKVVNINLVTTDQCSKKKYEGSDFGKRVADGCGS